MLQTNNLPVLKVEDLNIYYGTQHAVHDVTFDIHRGEIFGLLGPNGAGKTSTLSAVEGLIQPKSGKITVAGYNFREHPIEIRQNLGVQLQATSFQSELNVLEIIRLYAGLYGVTLSKERIREILREVQLEGEIAKRFGQLSGGQQQRVSLVISMIHKPQLLLLDEPTTGLDPQSRRQLWERIEKMKQSDRSILLTTHSMEEAEAVCDRIAIIDHGKIITIQSPSGLIEKYKDDPRVISVSRKGKITLEDVFIGLTGHEIRS